MYKVRVVCGGMVLLINSMKIIEN